MPFVILILAWPFLEIAAFVTVGARLGVFATLALAVLTSVAGAILLRIEGTRALMLMMGDVRAGRKPKIADAMLVALGGALLLLPGFLSDVLGLLLFIPPVRKAIIAYLSRHADWVVVSRTQQAGVYDLEPENWSRRDDPEAPNGTLPPPPGGRPTQTGD